MFIVYHSTERIFVTSPEKETSFLKIRGWEKEVDPKYTRKEISEECVNIWVGGLNFG